MTQEEKDLLLKDLCARVPYYVIVHVEHDWIYGGVKPYAYDCILHTEDMLPIKNFIRHKEFEIRPYLRPMSSMTEEEDEEMQKVLGCGEDAAISNKRCGLELWLESVDTDPTIWLGNILDVVDWLNRKMFDYRGLIPMGLALPAKEGMYKEGGEE